MTMKARGKRRPVRPAQIARAIDEGRESLDLYLDEISRVPLLNREEEMELAAVGEGAKSSITETPQEMQMPGMEEPKKKSQ